MSDDNQVLVPRSFIELFIAPGRLRPSESRDVIEQRHEFCEDMAQMLTETARAKRFELGVTEADVLERMARGLHAEGSVLRHAEAGWLVCRLAELLGWPMPP